MTDSKARDREALNALREQRATETEVAQARLKEQVKVEREIARVFKDGPMTVPTLAEATGLPAHIVFWHLSFWSCSPSASLPTPSTGLWPTACTG
jgi:hypothetical protein